MSPRIKVLRKVQNPPLIKGFKPYGPELRKQNSEPVNLLYEEYEAIRLSDYNKLNHHQASLEMGISRPTFTRIYASALQNIAKAFVEGRQISIEGGKVYFDSNWYHCKNCTCYFNNTSIETQGVNCPLCGFPEISEYDFDNSSLDVNPKNCGDFCICTNCGHEQQNQSTMPCFEKRCEKCNTIMKTKEYPNCKM